MGHTLNEDTGCHEAPAVSSLSPFCGTLLFKVSSLRAGRSQAGTGCYKIIFWLVVGRETMDFLAERRLIVYYVIA